MAADRQMPWSVKGVSPQARRLAKQAALQVGQPIGVWLSAAIELYAAQSPAEGAGPRDGGASAPGLADLSGRIDGLEVQGQSTLRLLHQTIESLTRRIAVLEARQAEADPA